MQRILIVKLDDFANFLISRFPTDDLNQFSRFVIARAVSILALPIAILLFSAATVPGIVVGWISTVGTPGLWSEAGAKALLLLRQLAIHGIRANRRQQRISLT